MSRVELLIDPLRISRQHVDVEVKNNIEARAAREKVRAHLLASGADVIRVRMDKQAFRLFEDLEGLTDLKVLPISARGEFARKIHGLLPAWCSDELIVSFDLLDKICPVTPDFLTLNVDLKILFLVNDVLVTTDSPEALLLAIRNIAVPIQRLISADAISSRIQSILSNKLDLSEIAHVFKLLQSDNFAPLIDSIFVEIVLEQIRHFVSRTKISLAIPPRKVPLTISSKLTLTSDWWETIGLEKMIDSLTRRVFQCVEKGQLGADEIPAIIYGYDQTQLNTIVLALGAHPEFATVELLEAVRNLRRLDTIEIENAIQAHLQVVPPAPLEIESSAKEAIDWAQLYLIYAANTFRRGSEPCSTISKSFSDWVSAQPGRINNSQWNWRAVSKSVEQSLQERKIVVLLVVDALGTVLTKPLVEQLRAMDESLHIDEKVLFAPLPTITEIGKLAVAAGRDVHKLPGDVETSLRLAYMEFLADPSEFQFQRGWTAGAKVMAPSTRLLIFFENQLDDQLHECLNYGDLDDQLTIVYSKIGKWVKQWAEEARARGKDFEIFITADHGLTRIESIQEFSIKREDGSVGERHVRLANTKLLTPPGFYRVSAEGAPDSCYLIPHDRVRLIKKVQPFVHGGMTPEEVLIPLISIRPMRGDDDRPIALQLEKPLAPLYSDGWAVQLNVTSGTVPLRSVSIRAEAPFEGEWRVNSLAANETLSVMLHLHATVPQEGAVAIGFSLRFLLPNATTYSLAEVSLDVALQPRILIRGQGEIDFDNMFE